MRVASAYSCGAEKSICMFVDCLSFIPTGAGQPSVQAIRVEVRRITRRVGAMGCVAGTMAGSSMVLAGSLTVSAGSASKTNGSAVWVVGIVCLTGAVLGEVRDSGCSVGSETVTGVSTWATTVGAGCSSWNSVGSVIISRATDAAAALIHTGHSGRVRLLLPAIMAASSSCRRRLASTVRLASNSCCNSLSSMTHCF